jgi:CDP-4-dehydro-6-deoxyglucose reductase
MTFSISKLFFRKRASVVLKDESKRVVNYSLAKNQSVLELLLENGHEIPNSCRAGDCQSCMLQSSTPESIPKMSQKGLSESEKSLGYFLSCQCFPTNSIEIDQSNAEQAPIELKILDKSFLSEQVLRLRLERSISVLAGQYINLFHPNDASRSYSVASSNSEDFLEFHIKKIEGGLFSTWAAQELSVGDSLKVQGPFGKCIYVPGHKHYLLSGIGTGYSPLRGILLEILNDANNDATIDIVLGGRDKASIYAIEELTELKNIHPRINTHFISMAEDASSQCVQADIYAYCAQHWGNLKESVVYLCGAPSFVQKMKKQCFLSDASMSNIYSDPFTPAS